MRIGFYVATFPALSETFVLDQITGLIDLGHEVHIHAFPPTTGDVVHGTVDDYQLMDHTTHFQKGAKGNVDLAKRAVAGGPRAWRTLTKSMAVNREGMARRALLGYRGIVFEQATDYDVILCHFGRRGRELAALRAIGALATPFATVFHGYDMSRYVDAYGDGVYDQLFEHGELFLPISDHWCERLIALGAPKDRVVVHRMGVDTAALPFKRRKPPSQGPVELVSVARLVEKKGLTYALDAVSRLGDIPVRYRIVGDGPLREDLEREILQRGLGDRVELLGWQPRERTQEILREAHIMLAPSVTAADGDKEGIPVSLMEALAGGLPVIATFHSGIPELIVDGESGHLVAERDADALLQKLAALIAQPEQWAQLGHAGRARVEAEFDVGALNQRLAGLLEGIASAR